MDALSARLLLLKAAGIPELTVEHGGVLVRNDFSAIKVAAPSVAVNAEAKEIRGDGWTLALNPGWTLKPDSSRQGSFIAARSQ